MGRLVADQVVGTFLTTAGIGSAPGSRGTGLDGPAWMYGPEARDRLRVWIAVGVLMWHHNVPAPDALALLRAHAYSHNESVEADRTAHRCGTHNSSLPHAPIIDSGAPLVTLRTS